MIFFFGEGRLGNRIFQYAFIKSVEEDHRVILSHDFDEMKKLFEGLDSIKSIRNKLLQGFCHRIVGPILSVLARARVITGYEVVKTRLNGFEVEDVKYTKRRGLLPFRYVAPGHMQSEKFFREASMEVLKIRAEHLNAAGAFLRGLPPGSVPVFVHVRRGDYVNEAALGKRGLTLPLGYYKDQMRWFERNVPGAFFVFLTDDAEFVDLLFTDFARKVISPHSQYVDFAIMTLCQYGIISNSSFAWWGAFFMKDRKKVFAPQFWMGWKSATEYPLGISPSFTDIVDPRPKTL